MSQALAITPSGVSAITFATAATGLTGIDGKYLLKGRRASENNAQEGIKAPYVDGLAIHWHGYSGGSIVGPFEVVYVKTSPANCMSAFESDLAAMRGKSCSLAYNSQTYPAAYLKKFEVARGPRPTLQNSMYRMHFVIEFEQKRLS